MNLDVPSLGELQITSGNPSAEEVAALVVALMAVRAATPAPGTGASAGRALRPLRPAHLPAGSWGAAGRRWRGAG